MAAHDGAVHDRLRASLSWSFNPAASNPLVWRSAPARRPRCPRPDDAQRSSGHRHRLRQRSAAMAHLHPGHGPVLRGRLQNPESYDPEEFSNKLFSMATSDTSWGGDLPGLLLIYWYGPCFWNPCPTREYTAAFGGTKGKGRVSSWRIFSKTPWVCFSPLWERNWPSL